MAGVGHRHHPRVAHALRDPLGRLIGYEIALSAPDVQRGTPDAPGILPQLIAGPSADIGVPEDRVPLPAPLAVGELAKLVPQAPSKLLLGPTRIHPLRRLHVLLQGVGLRGQKVPDAHPGRLRQRARRRHLHHHQGTQLVGVLPGVDQGIAAPHGMPNHHHGSQAQRRYNVGDILHLSVACIVAIGRPLALPVAPLVQGDDVMVVAEGQSGEVPRVGRLGTTVEEQHRWLPLIAPVQVVES